MPHDDEGMSRKTAAWLLAGLTALAFALRIWRSRVGLPLVFHSDFEQILQAVRLVRDGAFADDYMYPVAQVYLYALALLAAFCAGRLAGWDGYGSFARFQQTIARPEVHHAIGRAWTAVAASLVVIGVYRLARVRFGRGTAVLAAAAIALDPLHVLFAHQVRPHLVAIVLLVFAARPALRLSLAGATRKDALVAGLAAGACAAVFQFGFLLAGATAALLAMERLRGRIGWRSLLALGLVLGAGFAAAAIGVTALARMPGVVIPGAATEFSYRNSARLGFLPGHLDLEASRIGELALSIVAAVPACAAAVLLFAVLCIAGARRWTDLVRFGAYPALVVAAMSLLGAAPRYTLSATPFLAVLAAAAATGLRGRAARAIAAFVLLAVPLASTLRLEALLATEDTRTALAAGLAAPADPAIRIAVDSNLLPPTALPAGATWFPPAGTHMALAQKPSLWPTLFEKVAPDLFVRSPARWADTPLRDAWLLAKGFERTAVIAAAPPGTVALPDAPELLLPALWTTRRLGPTIELWSRRPAAAARAKSLVERARSE